MNIREFVKSNPINVNETQSWIDLIQLFIKEYKLKSELFEDDNGQGIELYSESEHILIEDMLYYVENTTTTLHYIFEGNVLIGLGEEIE